MQATGFFIDLPGVAILQSGREVGTKETGSCVKDEYGKRDIGTIEPYVKERTVRTAPTLGNRAADMGTKYSIRSHL